MLAYGGFEIAILVLLAIALMHYSQVLKKNTKTLKWFLAGAASFIIAGVFYLVDYVAVWTTANGVNYGNALFSIIGWFLILVGGLKLMYETLSE